MQSTASPESRQQDAAQSSRRAPSQPAVNQPLYRIDGPINAAVPSQQSSHLWLTAVASVLPIALYALAVLGLGAALLFQALITPLYTDAGYGIGSLALALAGGALIVLAYRPFLLTTIDSNAFAAVSADAEIDLEKLVADVASVLNVSPPESILLSVEPVVRAVPRSQGAVPNFDQQRLIIGIPAMMALSQRELGGAIAHELGHFAVPENRRQRIVVATVVMMLAQAANGTDRLDRLLRRDTSVSPVVRGVFQKVINSGRWPLRSLLALTERIARQTINEIEFHGDWFQAELVGAEALRVTAEKLHLLAHAQEQWLAEVTRNPPARYPSDLARVLFDSAHRNFEHRDKLLRDVMLEEQTFVRGAHPAGHARIDRMTTMCMTPGGMHGDSSAAVLLLQPAPSARQATLAYLRKGLRLALTDDDLMSEAAISQQMAEEREHEAVLDQYLLGFYARRRYLPPGEPGAVLKLAVDKRVEQIESLCDDIRRASPEARASLKTYLTALDAAIDASVHVAVDALQTDDEPDWSEAAEARRSLKDADRELSDAEQRYADRLALGVANALSDAVRESPANARVLQKKLVRLVAVQSAFASAKDSIVATREALAIARAVKASEHAKPDDIENARKAAAAAVEEMRRHFVRLPDPLVDGDQPFLKAVDEAVNASSDGSVMATVRDFLDTMDRTYLNVMVRLAESALASEKQHGIRLKLI